MATRQLTGSRIRARRLDRGMKQANLAKIAQISPSYLNLIEHNRRRIGGRLLNVLAVALEVDPASFGEGAEDGLSENLRLIAAAHPQIDTEQSRVTDLAGRFPGWSALVLAQQSQIEALTQRVAALSDRMAHDPQLSSSLLEVISTATAIRSTASILVGGEALDQDWQARFHDNIYADSQRLAESSRSLAAVLEDLGGEGATARRPMEALEAFLNAHDFHFEMLEGDASPAEISTLIDASQDLITQGDRDAAQTYLTRYYNDAQALPLTAFSQRAIALEHDPAALAQVFDVDLAMVLRRMAALPMGAGHPHFGLSICDGAGGVLLSKSVANLALPHIEACPLWPLFQALSRPNQPLRQHVKLPREPSQTFMCYAIAQPIGAMSFAAPARMEATMLLRPDPPTSSDQPTPVGLSCRICPRTDCNARREPAIFTP